MKYIIQKYISISWAPEHSVIFIVHMGMRCPNPKPRLWEGRNQEEDIEIFGFEETKYERK
jgi:hypothetical protein